MEKIVYSLIVCFTEVKQETTQMTNDLRIFAQNVRYNSSLKSTFHRSTEKFQV